MGSRSRGSPEVRDPTYPARRLISGSIRVLYLHLSEGACIEGVTPPFSAMAIRSSISISGAVPIVPLGRAEGLLALSALLAREATSNSGGSLMIRLNGRRLEGLSRPPVNAWIRMRAQATQEVC